MGFRRTPLAAARWMVIDCETSGLDMHKDRLLSVAAVEVAGGRIPPGRSYAAVVRQDVPSAADNILIHQLGADTQLGGRPPADVIRELDAFVDDAIAVAFHAPFDREILRRSGLHAARKRWLDLAALAPAFFPGRAGPDLDGWLAAFGIECLARHDALGDAYATAQLHLVVLAEARRQRVATAQELMRLAASASWLGN
jgi:DNA polymerase III subunit epsilon